MFKNTLLVFLGFASFTYAQDLKRLPDNINKSERTEYAPTISADGKTLIFECDSSSYWRLYLTRKLSDGQWSQPEYMSTVNNTDKAGDFIGGPFLTYDNNYLLVTSDRAGTEGLQDLWYSERNGNDWGKPVNFGKTINTSDYEGFPSMSPDGKDLYFMKYANDAHSCFAIFVSHKNQAGEWSTPEKLPAPINLECEEFPRIMPDGKTLVFASKREGSRGYDLYKSTLQKDNTWSEPIAMDVFNTEEDDNFISVPASGTIVYLGKDYQGSNDIFTANLPENLRPQKNALLKGVVVDKDTQKPVAGTVTITDLAIKKEIASIQANPGDGFYSIVLTEGANYDISVSQKGYSFYSTQLNLTKIDQYKEIEKRIELVPLKANAKFSLNNVNFDTGSSVVKETFYPELDRVIKLMQENPNLVVEISAHTDNIGDATKNLTLSQQRAASVFKYLTTKGLDAKRLVAKGYGMTQPLVPNSSDANRAQNRRVEFKVIK